MAYGHSLAIGCRSRESGMAITLAVELEPGVERATGPDRGGGAPLRPGGVGGGGGGGAGGNMSRGDIVIENVSHLARTGFGWWRRMSMVRLEGRPEPFRVEESRRFVLSNDYDVEGSSSVVLEEVQFLAFGRVG